MVILSGLGRLTVAGLTKQAAVTGPTYSPQCTDSLPSSDTAGHSSRELSDSSDSPPRLLSLATLASSSLSH